MAEWARKAPKLVVVDGCFMHCDGRIMKRVAGSENMVQFDALPMHDKGGKYPESMLVDEVPGAERNRLARHVANEDLAALGE